MTNAPVRSHARRKPATTSSRRLRLTPAPSTSTSPAASLRPLGSASISRWASMPKATPRAAIRKRPPAASSDWRRRFGRPRLWRDAPLRNPALGVSEERRPDNAGRRGDVVRHPPPGRRDGGRQRDHPRPRGSEPLRIRTCSTPPLKPSRCVAGSERRTLRHISTSTT